MTDLIPEDRSFALCLTHDIDRPYKQWQAPYYLFTERDWRQLRALAPSVNPWWQFGRVMDIERDLGVRSACYFLQEPHVLDRAPAEWTELRFWIESLGRYEVTDPAIAEMIEELDAGGWEIGVHGSIGSHADAERLRTEKRRIEALIPGSVEGVRQHHLELDRPKTWRIQRRVGLQYDTSLGSAASVGFEHGYDPILPFDDDFVVFPTTIMDKALDGIADSTAEGWEICESLLTEAREHGAVMTVLWHLRNFCERDYPDHGSLYRRLIERALEMDAWVGPPGKLYARLASEIEA